MSYRLAKRQLRSRVQIKALRPARAYLNPETYMRSNYVARLALLPVLLGIGLASIRAQDLTPFVSGSTGVLGDVEILADTTIPLPPDGVLHYRKLTIGTNITVRFLPNAANTPVYLLATGAVRIDGILLLNGEPGQPNGLGGVAGPGGYEGGNTTPNLQSGRGPGAPKAGVRGVASHATAGAAGAGPIYGDPLLVSLVGGSGGAAISADGALRSGGGGGGAILIASDVSIRLTGQIQARGARGGAGFENSGSGGAVRLVAPLITGTGRILAGNEGSETAGAGRVRVDCLNRSGFLFDTSGGVYSAGANMLARLPITPTLRIVHAAGTDIPVTAQGIVRVVLPNGASANQPIRIQAQGFNSPVPFQVTLYPESGNPVQIDDTIDNTSVNPAVKEIQAVFSPNVPTRVMVWTKP